MALDTDITRRRALLAGGGTLAFGGGVAYLASRPDSNSSDETYIPETSNRSDETTGFGAELAGRPIAGDLDAPIDVYYWTDYLCPFCARFEAETLPRLGREYVDAGTVQFVLLPYPNIGSYSMEAMVWSLCVWDVVADETPAAYWNWHHRVFERQSDAESNSDWATADAFATITDETTDVPLADVEACREERSQDIQDSIQGDLALGQSAGIQGTPGFVIYNREADAAGRIVGAQPYDNFADAIEQVRNA
ncbi:DsbA family protein [Natronosalvus rutilus]|uniref:DsbA family protein n=1 Tax=Natronosalvus rutilus TaxID=2953753 RepID=A0A9E7SYM1_9EURY|nr:DsbA family protein [Natronosalvus rutilus]UTF55213.1 DsbA family protein [Natronosalvus rutilus]